MAAAALNGRHLSASTYCNVHSFETKLPSKKAIIEAGVNLLPLLWRLRRRKQIFSQLREAASEVTREVLWPLHAEGIRILHYSVLKRGNFDQFMDGRESASALFHSIAPSAQTQRFQRSHRHQTPIMIERKKGVIFFCLALLTPRFLDSIRTVRT